VSTKVWWICTERDGLGRRLFLHSIGTDRFCCTALKQHNFGGWNWCVPKQSSRLVCRCTRQCVVGSQEAIGEYNYPHFGGSSLLSDCPFVLNPSRRMETRILGDVACYMQRSSGPCPLRSRSNSTARSPPMCVCDFCSGIFYVGDAYQGYY
jgi:hypothetical protein